MVILKENREVHGLFRKQLKRELEEKLVRSEFMKLENNFEI